MRVATRVTSSLTFFVDQVLPLPLLKNSGGSGSPPILGGNQRLWCAIIGENGWRRGPICRSLQHPCGYFHSSSRSTRKRLIGVQRERKAADQPCRLNADQKAAALAQKEREFRELILRAYKAAGFGQGGQAEDGFFHGARNGRLVVIGPINLPVGRLFVEEVITACRKRGASRADILAFEFEMGLFPAVLDEARAKASTSRLSTSRRRCSTNAPSTRARSFSTT